MCEKIISEDLQRCQQKNIALSKHGKYMRLGIFAQDLLLSADAQPHQERNNKELLHDNSFGGRLWTTEGLEDLSEIESSPKIPNSFSGEIGKDNPTYSLKLKLTDGIPIIIKPKFYLQISIF